MQPFKINAEWDEEAKVWIASSSDIDGLAIEVSTIDALIERLRIVIPELQEANSNNLNEELPFMLDGFFTYKTHQHLGS
jgi:hypothetical protein